MSPMMAIDDPFLAKLLRQHRRAAGLTQEELADRAGISTRTISDIERGLRTTMYRETALRLATALGLEGEQRSKFEAAARGRIPPQLDEAWRAGEQGRLAAAGLPAQPTRLIGRERELEMVLAALTDPAVRLLTLTGPGGIGKTRLAVEAASRAEALFSDGVFFVSLAETREPGSVLPVIAHTLGVITAQEPLVEALAQRLSGKRALLVLDTFEQVLDDASMIGELLVASSGLTVLVTSREILRLRSEREFEVPTLELPSPETGMSPADIGRYAALALFVDRARAVRPDLVLDQEAAESVAEICRRVNGLPLAVELAAARVKHLPLPTLLDHLEHRLTVLTRGPRDLPLRQQTMRDTVGWSYDLLESAEQTLFRGLSVFGGGWTVSAAASVCASDEGDLLPVLSALIDKSLVTVARAAGTEPRYRMLDVVRDFAAEQRAAAGESDVLLQRHAEHYLAVAEAAAPQIGRAAQEMWFGVLDAEHDNLRAALRYAIERQQAEVSLRVAGALWQFWLRRGHHTEGRLWLRQALALDHAAAGPARMKVLWGAAWLAYHQGDYDEMEQLGKELLPLARAEGEPADMRNALTVAGMVAMAQASYEEAVVPLQEALDICRGLGPSWLLATSLLNLGMASLHAGRSGAAEVLLEEAREVYGQLGDQRFSARSTQQIGYVALLQGDHVKASSLIGESLEAYSELADLWGVVESLEGIAACAAAAGTPERAARIAAAAEGLRERLATYPLPFDRALTDRYLATARASVDEHTWQAAWEEGRGMSLDEVVEISRRD